MSALLKWAKRANDALLGIETAFMAVITFFLVAAIFIEVICRYFLFISVAWAEELTRYLFIWLTYIGSAYAIYYGQHTEIDVVQQMIVKSKSEKKEAALKGLRLAAIISTFAFLVVFGKVFFDYMMVIWAKTQTSPTMHIPMGYIYLPVFIGTVMAAIHEIYMFLDEIAGKSGQPEAAEK